MLEALKKLQEMEDFHHVEIYKEKVIVYFRKPEIFASVEEFARWLGVDYCKWEEDEDCWKTECGNKFELTEGTPQDNEMKYCPFCGRKIKWKLMKKKC